MKLDSWKDMKRFLTTFFTVILAFTAVLAQNQPPHHLRNYFDLLESGNFESATYMWTEAAQERSSRFDIEYENIPIRIDCSSPVVRYLDRVRFRHLDPPAKSIEQLAGSRFVRLHYQAVVDGELLEHDYYIVSDGGYFWLTYPQDFIAADWLVTETKYLRIHHQPGQGKYLNELILSKADSFVEKTAQLLEIPKKDIEAIAEKKIEYFYCKSDDKVEEITGFHIKGTLDLASNDIISAFFPHYHEIAHLLVNIKLKQLPLYTLPVMREGIAICYAGRWGKTPQTLNDLGGYLLKHEIVALDSILTMEGFRNHAGSDIAYPVAGLLSSYLLDRIGPHKFMQLYRQFSGEFEKVNEFTNDQVYQMLTRATSDDSWELFMERFNKFANETIQSRAVAVPGALDKGELILTRENLIIRKDKDWLSVEFIGLPTGPPTGNLLFGHDQRLEKSASAMFEEQYQGNESFEGYRFGIRFDRNEAGLYDYGTNHLLAKYIWGISPSEDYFDEEHNRLTIRFQTELFEDQFPTEGKFKLLDY